MTLVKSSAKDAGDTQPLLLALLDQMQAWEEGNRKILVPILLSTRTFHKGRRTVSTASTS
jgi:hypothetical protein